MELNRFLYQALYLLTLSSHEKYDMCIIQLVCFPWFVFVFQSSNRDAQPVVLLVNFCGLWSNLKYQRLSDPAPYGLLGYKNRVYSVSWPEVVKGIANCGVDCSVSYGSFSLCLLCLGCMWCFVSLFLVVSTSAIDFLERIFSEMTRCVSSGTSNLDTHSLLSHPQSLVHVYNSNVLCHT